MPSLVESLALVAEALLVLSVVIVLIRRRRSGASGSGIIPAPVFRFVIAEIDIWKSAWRYVFTSRDREKFYPANRSIFGYMVIFALVTGPVELLLVHVLIPSELIAWIVTGLSIYGLFWVAGMYASIRTIPHSISDDRITLRFGILAEVSFPINDVSSVAANVTNSTKGGDGLRSIVGESDEMETWITSGGQADVTIVLDSEAQPRGLIRTGSPSRVVHVAVDRPEDFVDFIQSNQLAHESA